MRISRHQFWVIGAVLTLGACNGKSTTAPSSPAPTPTTTPAPAPAPPPVPTGWKVSGRVVSNPDGRPVAGATILLDGIAPETSGPDGQYALDTPPGSNRPLGISADGYQYRETFLRGGEVRSNVDLDLIPTNGTFPFSLYRQMARNTWEQPTQLQPLQHWTKSPNIHLENRWRDTGAPIADDILLYIADEIRRVIPQLTGGRFAAGRIDIDAEVWNFVPDYVSIHFNHSGNYGVVGANPGMVQFGTAAKCTSIMVIHELGHAMGYWHSSVQPSVMGGHVLGTCNPENLWPDEQQVARVLYSRPPGNVEPDRDPPASFAYLQAPDAVPPIAICPMFDR